MTNNDKPAFAQVMALLQEVFVPDKPISKEKVRLYFEILLPHEIGDVCRAAEKIIKTKRYATFPLPAEFREALGEGTDEGKLEIRALAAWEYACARYDGRQGGVDDPLLDEAIRIAFGGWARFGQTDPDREAIDRKHFLDCFKALAEREVHDGIETSMLNQLAANRERVKAIVAQSEPR